MLWFQVKPMKMPLGLKSGFKILYFWIYWHMVIYLEVKIKHTLSICVSVSVAAVEGARNQHYINTAEYHQNAKW